MKLKNVYFNDINTRQYNSKNIFSAQYQPFLMGRVGEAEFQFFCSWF